MFSDRKVHHALSSDARLQIIDLLYRTPLDIEEIAKKINLQPVTVRHHIQALIEAGLIESQEKRSGNAGRPKEYYSISQFLPLANYPQRYYNDLAKKIVNYLLKKFGAEKTHEMMTELGEIIARDTMSYLLSTNDIKRWDATTFINIYIKYLEEIGAQPEVIEKKENKLTFRVHNCVLRELSKEQSGIFCEVMHHWFNSSLYKLMNQSIQCKQTTCMGHGDQYCEQIVEWQPEKQ